MTTSMINTTKSREAAENLRRVEAMSRYTIPLGFSFAILSVFLCTSLAQEDDFHKVLLNLAAMLGVGILWGRVIQQLVSAYCLGQASLLELVSELAEEEQKANVAPAPPQEPEKQVKAEVPPAEALPVKSKRVPPKRKPKVVSQA